MKRRRLQFGLLTLAILVTASAVLLSVFRPGVFPSDRLIREDLGIPDSIAIRVFDRQTISLPKGGTDYWATVHVAEKPHRLVRVSCTAKETLSYRRKWAPYYIVDHYDNGSFDFRMCEQLYGAAPTEKEIEEFRQFVLNFK